MYMQEARLIAPQAIKKNEARDNPNPATTPSALLEVWVEVGALDEEVAAEEVAALEVGGLAVKVEGGPVTVRPSDGILATPIKRLDTGSNRRNWLKSL